MPSDDTAPHDRGAPGAAAAIVEHASAVCADANVLWEVLSSVSIPTDLLTDQRQQHKVTHGTEEMARAYLYQTIKDLSQKILAKRLENHPSLLKGFGFDEPPEQ